MCGQLKPVAVAHCDGERQTRTIGPTWRRLIAKPRWILVGASVRDPRRPKETCLELDYPAMPGADGTWSPASDQQGKSSNPCSKSARRRAPRRNANDLLIRLRFYHDRCQEQLAIRADRLSGVSRSDCVIACASNIACNASNVSARATDLRGFELLGTDQAIHCLHIDPERPCGVEA